MNRRPLGKSGLLVSEVGLGCEHLQGMEYGQIKAVVDAALDAGINIFDIFMRIFSPGLKRIPSIWGCSILWIRRRTTPVCSTAP